MLCILQVDELRQAMGFPNSYLFNHGKGRMNDTVSAYDATPTIASAGSMIVYPI